MYSATSYTIYRHWPIWKSSPFSNCLVHFTVPMTSLLFPEKKSSPCCQILQLFMSDSSLFVAKASNGTTSAIPLPNCRSWCFPANRTPDQCLPRQDPCRKAAEFPPALLRGQKILKAMEQSSTRGLATLLACDKQQNILRLLPPALSGEWTREWRTL